GFSTGVFGGEAWAEDLYPAEGRRIPTFALVTGRRPSNADRAGDAGAPPRRIVVADSVRIGEGLIALRVIPARARRYGLNDPDGESSWPWPDLVERTVRDRVKDVGYRGADLELVERAEPDLILDLRFEPGGPSTTEVSSAGGVHLSDLHRIAPTV